VCRRERLAFCPPRGVESRASGDVPGHEGRSVVAEPKTVLVILDQFAFLEKVGIAGSLQTSRAVGRPL
jgi:hypothetical protein